MRVVATVVLLGVLLVADNVSQAARLPGCARGAVEISALYGAMLPGAYLLEPYAKALLSVRDHVAAASRIHDERPIAAFVAEQADYKTLQLIFHFHEAMTLVRLYPDGRREPNPEASEAAPASVTMPSRCAVKIDYKKFGPLDYRYVGPSAERFISDVMFAGVYTDQTGGRWQIHNGIAITPTQSFRYDFGIDLVGDAGYWKNGLLLKDKQADETYEAYLARGRKVEVFLYESDETVRLDPRHKRKRVWTLRRARGRE
jgi:hypothetical protein